MAGLKTTTDKLRLITSTGADIHVALEYTDMLNFASGTQRSVPGTQNQIVASAGTVTIMDQPASSSDFRKLEECTLRNVDASLSCDVTVYLEQTGPVNHEIVKYTLKPGETLQYNGVGWYPIAMPNLNPRVLTTTADQSNSTTTPTEVTELSVIGTGLGVITFEYYIRLQSGATTTGYKVSVNHTGTVSFFMANVFWHGGVANNSDDVIDQDHVAAGAGTVSGFAARAKSTAGWGAITDVDTANADVMMRITGLCGVTADGDLELWHGSDAAAISYVKAGTTLVWNRQ